MGEFDVPTQQEMSAYTPPTAEEAQAAIDAARQRQALSQIPAMTPERQWKVQPKPAAQPSNQSAAAAVAGAAAQAQQQPEGGDAFSKVSAPDAEAAREQLRLASLGTGPTRGTPAYDAKAAWSVQKGIPVPDEVREKYETAYVDQQAAAVSQQEASNAQFQAAKEQADQILQIQTEHEEQLKQAQADSYVKQAAAIAPQNIFERKGVFGGIMAAFSLGLGGMGAASGNGQNAALAIFQNELAQDHALKMKRYELEGINGVEAQKRILAAQAAQIQHVAVGIGQWAEKASTQQAQQAALQTKASLEGLYGDRLLKLATISGDNVTESWRHVAATGGSGGGLSPQTRIAIAHAYGDIGAQDQPRPGTAAGTKAGNLEISEQQKANLSDLHRSVVDLAKLDPGMFQSPSTSGHVKGLATQAMAQMMGAYGAQGIVARQMPLFESLKKLASGGMVDKDRMFVTGTLEAAAKEIQRQVAQRKPGELIGTPVSRGGTKDAEVPEVQ